MLTVLIVDDEPNIVQLVRLTLETARVRVFEAPDGATAIGQAIALRPDLVLLDVDLPDVSGLEVCRRLRAEAALAHTKIVMLTAAAQQDEVAFIRSPARDRREKTGPTRAGPGQGCPTTRAASN